MRTLLGRAAWLAASAGWVLFVGIIAGRNLAGALTQQNASAFLACSLLASFLAVGLAYRSLEFRNPARTFQPTSLSGDRAFVRTAFALLLVLFAFGLTVHRGSIVELLAVWAPVLAAVAMLLPGVVYEWKSRESAGKGSVSRGAIPSNSPESKQPWQQLSRRVADGGSDIVEGTIVVVLLPGERAAISHVAFCPPFAETPRLAYQIECAAAARLKVGQLLPHGARFEVRLDAPQVERVEAKIWFSAAHDGASHDRASNKRPQRASA